MKRLIPAFLSAAGLCFATLEPPDNLGYVVDNGTGQVWVVDLVLKQVYRTIPVGVSPAEMLVLPGNDFAFVSNHDDGTVSVVDLRDGGSLRSTIQVSQGPGPGSLSCTPDGLFVYVANDTDNTVSVIDTTALSVAARIAVGATPIQVNIDPTGRFAYVVNQDDGTVSVIDVHRNQVVKTLQVGTQPNQFAILPNLTTAYVLNKGSNDVTTVDLTRNDVTGLIPVGSNPVSVAYSSDSRRLYVVNSGSGSVSVVDTGTNQRLADIPAGSQPAAMVVTFDSRYGYVSNTGSNTVSLLDLSAGTKELDISVGASPFSLMLDPNEDFLYVSNMGSRSAAGSLTVIRIDSDLVIRSIATSGASAPVQFTMLNAPTLLEIAPNPALSGSTVVLGGEGFVPHSAVRVFPSAPTGMLGTRLDSQGLQVTLPTFTGSSVVVDVLNPDGNSSEQIVLRSGTSAPAIDSGGVALATGLAPAAGPISGNAIVTVSGGFPGMGAEAASTVPLPRALGDARVTFNGVAAPLFATVPSQPDSVIYALAPVRLLGRTAARVAVTIGDQTSPAETVSAAPASPGIFVISADGSAAVVRFADRIVTSSDPVPRGEMVEMYVTGLGQTTPPLIEGDGALLDVAASVTVPVKVSVGGVEATNVQFKGLTPTTSGLYQIDFQIPAALPSTGLVDVTVEAGGRVSNVAKIAVR